MNHNDKKLVTRLIVLCTSVAIGTLGLLSLCHPPIGILGNTCESLPDFEIFIGVAIGTVTTALFFWFIEKNQEKMQTELEKLGRIYSERTALLNLLDIFSGKAHKIQPNEKNRQRYEYMLEEYARGRVKDDQLYKIWKNTVEHTLDKFDIKFHGKECDECKKLDEIRDKHFKDFFVHQANCKKCEQLVNDIKKYLDEHENPKQGKH